MVVLGVKWNLRCGTTRRLPAAGYPAKHQRPKLGVADAEGHGPRLAGTAGALRIAVRDIRERGPKIMFEVPLGGGGSIRGTAERYWVLVTSQTEFPEEFRRRFTEFLGSLFLQSIQVSTGSA